VPRLKLIFAGAIAFAVLVPAPALAAAGACGASDYSYAGIQGPRRAHGVSATLTPISSPHVFAGHVAAWVGLGWAGAGPDAQDEWIQAGMASEAGDNVVHVYYEIVKPGAPYSYVELGEVSPGESHGLSVLELKNQPGWWRVWVDGKPAIDPVFLPGSHGAWEPVATAESWNGGVGACNQLQFRFEQVSWARRAGGWWQQLTGGYRFADPGYQVVRRSAATFLTLSRIFAG
jgi:hypothetical protein